MLGLAVEIFGKDSNVGEAIIDINKTLTPDWQLKVKEIIKKFNDKGISIPSEENQK